MKIWGMLIPIFVVRQVQVTSSFTMKQLGSTILGVGQPAESFILLMVCRMISSGDHRRSESATQSLHVVMGLRVEPVNSLLVETR